MEIKKFLDEFHVGEFVFYNEESAINFIQGLILGQVEYNDFNIKTKGMIYTDREDNIQLSIINKGQYPSPENKFVNVGLKSIQDFKYMEYEGGIPFEIIYKKALEIKLMFDFEINLLVYNGNIYKLYNKYKDNIPEYNWGDKFVKNRYKNGEKRHSRKGLEQSQKITQAILIKMGQ